MNRLSYLAWIVIATLVSVWLANIVDSPANAAAQNQLIALWVSTELVYFFCTWFRAEDAGKTRWLSVLALAPVVSLFVVIYLLFIPPKTTSSTGRISAA